MSDKRATREGFYAGLAELGKERPDIIAVDADLPKTTGSHAFCTAFPDRYVNVGIAEQNLVGMSAGLARVGFVPFCSSMAVFAVGRAFEIIRNAVAYSRVNVKIVGSHGGITAAGDGGSHQAVEDIAAMRGIPGMVILSPCDYNQAFKMARVMCEHDGPMYIRTSREPVENVTTMDDEVLPGKAQKLIDGGDLLIIATGMMTVLAVQAAGLLAAENIWPQVMNIHTIKPLDDAAILHEARRCGGRVLVCEEANMLGGLGEAVARVLVEEDGIRFSQVAVEDRFGQSGLTAELLEAYGITRENIAGKAKALIDR